MYVTDILRWSFHKSDSLCYVTWEQKGTKSCSISSDYVLKNKLILAPGSQGSGVIFVPIARCKARGRTVRSNSTTLKSEVKLSAEACKAQSLCLFWQYLVSANIFFIANHCLLAVQRFLIRAPAMVLNQQHPLQKSAGLMGLLLFTYQSLFKDMTGIAYSSLNIHLNIVTQADFQTGEVFSWSDLHCAF